MNKASTEIPRQLRLLRNRQRRLLSGHDWVFSNEVDPQSLKERQPAAGDLVHIADHRGTFLGTAWYNPATLIAGRLLSRERLTEFSLAMLRERLTAARAIRDRLYGVPWYRWVHGDSDRLPGLVVDRFGDWLSVQITTAGMERHRDALASLLAELGAARGIVFQRDLDFRRLEGLSTGEAEVQGEIPDGVLVREGDLEFSTSLTGGQKTGWFFDQRDNRARLARHVAGRTVADLYCYGGAWGIRAARSGASAVTCVDSSASAISAVQANAARNGVAVEAVQADCIDLLKSWQAAGRRFDVVIVDPPALIRRRKDVDAGTQAYYQLNRLATRCVSPGGLLVSCSCSHHLPEEELVRIVQHAAWSDGQRHASILEFGAQSADHPVHPAMPETRYLKALFVQLG